MCRAVEMARLALTTSAYASEWHRSAAEVTAQTWETIPFLDKERLIASVTDEDPFGGRLSVSCSELAWIFAAPGPVYMPYTAGDMDRVAAAYGAALGSCGLGDEDIVDQTLLYNWVIAASMVDRGLRSLGCAVVPGGPGGTEQHADHIRRSGITGIVAMPSFLEHLLEVLGDRPHRLRKAVIMGELRDADAKTRIEERYGVWAREFYGVGDVGAVAYECALGQGMHLRRDLLIEFVDPATGGIKEPAKGDPAEIVVTDFARRAMPIIRLRSGDLIDELITDPCACGNPAPRIPRIIGRANDITKVRGMFIIPQLVTRTLGQFGIEDEHCIVIDRTEGRDLIEVLIVGAHRGNVPVVAAAVSDALRIRCDVRFVDSLPSGSGLLRDRRAFQNQ
ncbi:phenylacetate--CoA ligase family protein [Saccharopolyspora spinosa]|nr:phenylacetate--CoA ligase family protein [Saccharopolyspora spinosa]